LSIRSEIDTGEFNPIHYGGKLFHQFCVDQAVRIEKDRMDYIIYNQTKMCAEKYQTVFEKFKKKIEINNLEIGKQVVLPSSVQGTPRWQSEQYQDAMTIVSRIGKPDLFLTMTCNPE
jgi:hypothetical protein